MEFFKESFELNVRVDKVYIYDILMNLEIETGGFEYSAKRYSDSVIVYNIKNKVSLYFNSFLPVIKITVAENKSYSILRITLVPSNSLKTTLRLLAAFVAVLEMSLILYMINYMPFEIFPLLIPIGMFSFTLVISLLFFKIFSTSVKTAIRTAIKEETD